MIRLLKVTVTGFLREVASIATSRERRRQFRHDPLYSNAFYLMLSSGTTAPLSLAFWILATRLYSPEAVGLASALVAASTFLAGLALLGMDFGIVRFMSLSGAAAGAMVNSCLTLSGLAAVLGVLVFVSTLDLWSPALLFLRQDPWVLAAFIVFTVGFALFNLSLNAFVGRRRSGFVLAGGLALNLSRVILLAVLAVALPAFGIFGAWGLSVLVALLACIFLFLPRVQPGYRPAFALRWETMKGIAGFSLANYLGSLLWIAPATILPLMTVNLLGAEATAYFWMAWTVASLLFTIPLGVAQSLFAEGSHDEAGLSHHAGRALRFGLLLLVPAVILVLAFSSQILLMFGGLYSQNATPLLRILAISALPVGINSIYFGVARVEKRLKAVVGLSAFVAVATLGLAYLLLPSLGINGVGVAWLASQGAVAVALAAYWLRRQRQARRPARPEVMEKLRAVSNLEDTLYLPRRSQEEK